MAVNSGKLQTVVGRFNVGEEKFDIGRVKNAHLAWRSKLEGVLRGVSSLRPEEVTSHQHCEFGKWYFSTEAAKFANLDIFKEIGMHHEAVHAHARSIVMHVQNGRKSEANGEMKLFEEVREKLFTALEALYTT